MIFLPIGESSLPLPLPHPPSLLLSRGRASHSISRAVGSSLIPIVIETFMEGFCAKWQKATGDAAKNFSRGEQVS